jgi:hypothetical protein
MNASKKLGIAEAKRVFTRYAVVWSVIISAWLAVCTAESQRAHAVLTRTSTLPTTATVIAGMEVR